MEYTSFSYITGSTSGTLIINIMSACLPWFDLNNNAVYNWVSLAYYVIFLGRGFLATLVALPSKQVCMLRENGGHFRPLAENPVDGNRSENKRRFLYLLLNRLTI